MKMKETSEAQKKKKSIFNGSIPPLSKSDVGAAITAFSMNFLGNDCQIA